MYCTPKTAKHSNLVLRRAHVTMTNRLDHDILNIIVLRNNNNTFEIRREHSTLSRRRLCYFDSAARLIVGHVCPTAFAKHTHADER